MVHMYVVVVGGGLAGSIAAAILGRAGFGVSLIDPHPIYPADFRCEKIDSSQAAILRRTGLADAVLSAATRDNEAWFARSGRVIDKRASDQYGIRYGDLVNNVRAQIPRRVNTIYGKVRAVSLSAKEQRLTLSNQELSARLVIFANGHNHRLRQSLGMQRVELSPCHSTAIGFDFKAVERPEFHSRATTYYFERARDRIAYLTLFPIGSALRANLMTYRDARDPWLRSFRQDPEATLLSLLPGLPRCIGGFEIIPPIAVRPIDLYSTRDYVRPGMVLVGDAFATSCPAAGTGLNKVFTDVERLCNVYIPQWLRTGGMDEEKITEFYRDPQKLAADRMSLKKAGYLRSLSSDPSLAWQIRRAAHSVVRCGRSLLHSAHAPSDTGRDFS